MPWKEVTTMSERRAFIREVVAGADQFSVLCRKYGISRKTGYKWLARYQQEGESGLSEHSRRPQHSPTRTAPAVEALIVQARQTHPAWGPRKLRHWLADRGHSELPAVSTISAILRRHGLIDPLEASKHRAFQRFEHATPNQLWQMDFKGYFQLGNGDCCYPLTVLDDHSRYLVGLQACRNEQRETVQSRLTTLFQHYGLPERMLMDNGSPWGDGAGTAFTRLTVWLLRLGVAVSHGRPYHPQTQGKDERLHRSLKTELLSRVDLPDWPRCQAHFDRWRQCYNHERPHDALDLAVPASRYQPSDRPFPEVLPALVYPPGDHVRKVDASGKISFRKWPVRVGKAFCGLLVGVRPDDLTDGVFHVYFCHTRVHTFDVRPNS